MKTLFKRILITTSSLVLLLSFMITPTSKVSAAEQVEQLENKYPNLRITNLEPSDVDYENAIYIDTQEEYETLLKSLNAISESEIIVPTYSSEVNPYASTVSPTSSLKISDIYTTHIGFIPLPPSIGRGKCILSRQLDSKMMNYIYLNTIFFLRNINRSSITISVTYIFLLIVSIYLIRLIIKFIKKLIETLKRK